MNRIKKHFHKAARNNIERELVREGKIYLIPNISDKTIDIYLERCKNNMIRTVGIFLLIVLAVFTAIKLAS